MRAADLSLPQVAKDLGIHNTAHEFQGFLKTHGIVSRMDGVGNYFDNAVVESCRVTKTRTGPSAPPSDPGVKARRDILHYMLKGFIIFSVGILILRDWSQGYMPK